MLMDHLMFIVSKLAFLMAIFHPAHDKMPDVRNYTYLVGEALSIAAMGSSNHRASKTHSQPLKTSVRIANSHPSGWPALERSSPVFL
jgi:hypothetical protein